jgi:hypothetical protein
VLLSIDLYEDFINVEGIAVTSVLALHSSGVNGSEFDTPEADRFAAEDNSSFSK